MLFTTPYCSVSNACTGIYCLLLTTAHYLVSTSLSLSLEVLRLDVKKKYQPPYDQALLNDALVSAATGEQSGGLDGVRP